MTLSLDDIDSRSTETITTTREALLDLIDQIALQWRTSRFNEDDEDQRAEMLYLGRWRKTARKTLKRILPYIGSYRRDIPPEHNLPEYTFPLTEYLGLAQILDELKIHSGPHGGLYRLPTQLPYIGLADPENPFTDSTGVELEKPRSTISPIMIHLCLAQKFQFLFEQLCHAHDRSPTLVDYLDHPLRHLSLKLARALDREWFELNKESNASESLVNGQRQILQEIERALDWHIIEEEMEREAGAHEDEWKSDSQVLHRILRENLDFVQENRSRSAETPKIYLPSIAEALQQFHQDGNDLAFLGIDAASNSRFDSKQSTTLSLGCARLNRRQNAFYEQ
ncbi:hypothetical protein JCM5350_004908 [Sporobolomyces pararoseus]